ncbi:MULTISPECIES: cyclophilin-like fold protein [unclassified Microbacterium]|uniref:cyclophilin-like fold protein n=1 Tax=unclassified Microbacterium TaxID=2609290 RepID=UPI00346784FC
MKIRITLPTGQAIGAIDDTPAGHELIDALPMTLTLGDLFDREKMGPSPQALKNVTDTLDTYAVGQIAYWAPSHDIVFFYADTGDLSIPEPGIVHLGTIIEGLEHIAASGEGFTMTLEQA